MKQTYEPMRHVASKQNTRLAMKNRSFRNMTIKSIGLLLTGLLFIWGCQHPQEDIQESPNSENKKNTNEVSLSEAELAQTNISTGLLEKRPISKAISCFGTIEASPKQTLSITSPLAGKITSLNYIPGDYVNKGAIMATMENLDFIKLQQAYLEAKALLKYTHENFKRQGQLTVENAASIKQMQQAEADYWSTKAKYESLKSQLQLLHADITAIEKGNFQSEIVLRATSSGYVTSISGNMGKYIQAETPIYQIVDISKLYAHMQVYQRSITHITPDMDMWIEVVGVPNTKYQTKVTIINQQINAEEETFTIHAPITNPQLRYKPGMKIQGEILLDKQEHYTLPVGGVVKYNGEPVVFIRQDHTFIPVKVTTGTEYNNFVTITNPPSQLINNQIVTNGAYFLVGQLLNEAE